MKLTLYKNKSANNVVNKNIVKVGNTLEGVLREECSVISPIITVEIENPSDCNYAKIGEFNRYYYITDMVSIRNNIWQLTLSVDVLYTYRNDIKELSAVINKQQGTKYSTELYNDGSFRTREDNFIEVWNFSNGFNDSGEFILLTAGAISGGS